MDLTLYYLPGTRAQRVRWALEELELDYRLERIDPFKGETDTRVARAERMMRRKRGIGLGLQVVFGNRRLQRHSEVRQRRALRARLVGFSHLVN